MLELNKIYNEDCLEGMKKIDDKSIDLIICDLPYGTTACSWDTIIPFDKLWEQYKRIIKDNSAIILTASQPFTTDLINSNRKWFKYELIYEKSRACGFLLSNIMPMKIHENIIIFSNGKPTYNPIKSIGKPYICKSGNTGGDFLSEKNKEKISNYLTINDGYRFPKSIIKFKAQTGLHPTQKPVALFEYLIRTYSNENDIVLDNCMGSGTTAIACINTNCKYIGFELNKEYYDLSIKRIDDYNKQLKLF